MEELFPTPYRTYLSIMMISLSPHGGMLGMKSDFGLANQSPGGAKHARNAKSAKDAKKGMQRLLALVTNSNTA